MFRASLLPRASCRRETKYYSHPTVALTGGWCTVIWPQLTSSCHPDRSRASRRSGGTWVFAGTWRLLVLL